MRLSASTNIYFNRPNNRKAKITETIYRASQAGYQYLDISFLDYTNFKTDFVTKEWEYWLDEVIVKASENDILFNQGHAPVYNVCDNKFKDKEWFDKMVHRSIICASKLGLKWLVFHAGTDFHSASLVRESIYKNKEYFLRINELATKYNVGVAIENLWDLSIAPKRRFTTTVEELLWLIEEIDDENVGVCWDFEHASIMEQNQREALLMIGKKLKATHVSDHLGATADHLLPFYGDTDWGDIMPVLKTIDYSGDLSFEIHRYIQNLPDELIKTALKHSHEVGLHLLKLANE